MARCARAEAPLSIKRELIDVGQPNVADEWGHNTIIPVTLIVVPW